MSRAFVTYPVAAKTHQCLDCREDIQPGDPYIREAWPPWTLLMDDPEPPYYPQGSWEVWRWHRACQPPPF